MSGMKDLGNKIHEILFGADNVRAYEVSPEAAKFITSGHNNGRGPGEHMVGEEYDGRLPAPTAPLAFVKDPTLMPKEGRKVARPNKGLDL